MSEDKVTLRDVYAAINRMEDNLKKDFGTRLDKVEAEVSMLKNFQNKALGFLAFISLFGSFSAQFIWNKLTGQV